GTDPNLNFYTGKDGSIKISFPNEKSKKGALVLSATYADHGLKNDPLQSLTAKDAIVVIIK
ncbi:MAG TPA: hypothetical protein VKQ08_08270, partial [Cyclobacteriaceae bacterium]|nr:hypothetical protein [Cyclobacteriaceae bacterium]